MSKQSLKLGIQAVFALAVGFIMLGVIVFAGGIGNTGKAQQEKLTIITSRGEEEFHVTMALTPQQQATGLMFRDKIDAGYGMLFVYPTVGPVTMWMKNTKIPLDMLFIDAKGIIVHIHEKARPFDETPIPSRHPAKAVLEIRGGEAAVRAIQVGDRIINPVFEGQAN